MRPMAMPETMPLMGTPAAIRDMQMAQMEASGLTWETITRSYGEVTHHVQVSELPAGTGRQQYVYPDRYLRTAKTEAHDICWGCRFDFTAAGYTNEQISEHGHQHLLAGENAGWGTGTAIVGYNVSKLSFSYSASDCEVTTIPAVTHTVHHDAEYKTVYICSGCGEEKK